MSNALRKHTTNKNTIRPAVVIAVLEKKIAREKGSSLWAKFRRLFFKTHAEKELDFVKAKLQELDPHNK